MSAKSERYQKAASLKTNCRSVVMLSEQKLMPEFEKFGVKVVGINSDKVLIVDVPVSSVDSFVELYNDRMEPGSWNEYVGPRTGFFGRLPSGEPRHIELSPQTQALINQFLQKFIPGWSLNEDLWEWLSSINIYADWLGGSTTRKP